MRISTIVPLVVVIGLSGAAVRAQEPAAAPAGYAWADACRSCHQPIYEAWARTKHATALDRLSGSDQEKACVGCHVTGTNARVLDGHKVVNAGIQCEACHGAAAAHVADPSVLTGLVRTPPASTCVTCHSEKSPHFKGFWYDAMKSVVHTTR